MTSRQILEFDYTDGSFFFFDLRVINAGKSMLNEDQASCDVLYVKKLSSKQQRASMMLEDSGVS